MKWEGGGTDASWAPSAGTTTRIALASTEAKWGQAQGYSHVLSMPGCPQGSRPYLYECGYPATKTHWPEPTCGGTE